MYETYIESVGTIIDAVAAHFGIPAKIIKDPTKRTSQVVLARHVGMYLATKMTYHSKEAIAKEFGQIGHASTIYAAKRIVEYLSHKPRNHTPPPEEVEVKKAVPAIKKALESKK